MYEPVETNNWTPSVNVCFLFGLVISSYHLPEPYCCLPHFLPPHFYISSCCSLPPESYITSLWCVCRWPVLLSCLPISLIPFICSLCSQYVPPLVFLNWLLLPPSPTAICNLNQYWLSAPYLIFGRRDRELYVAKSEDRGIKQHHKTNQKMLTCVLIHWVSISFNMIRAGIKQPTNINHLCSKKATYRIKTCFKGKTFCVKYEGKIWYWCVTTYFGPSLFSQSYSTYI